MRVLVKVPHPRVVGIRDLETLYPMFSPGITPSFGHDTRNEGGRADVNLKPLGICKGGNEKKMLCLLLILVCAAMTPVEVTLKH